MDKRSCQFIHIQGTVVAKMNQLFFYFFQRYKIVHTAINTGNDRNLILAFQKSANHLHSLTNQQISMYICLKKKKILCRIVINTFIIKTIIFIQFFRRFFICGNYQMTWKKPGKPIHKMSFLGLHTTTDLQNSTILFCLFLYFFHLCKILQRLQKCLHTFSIFLLNWFMAASTLSARIISTALQALSCASSTSLRSLLPNLPST